MLTAHQLSKAFNTTVLFQKCTFSINPGDRVGLVGCNGSGKTTLLRILAGEETPSSGSVSRDPRLRIGYLRQGYVFDPNLTLRQILAQSLGSVEALEAELAEVSRLLTHNLNDRTLQDRYDTILHRIQAADEGRVYAILKGLGLLNLPQNQNAAVLSGGQKTRLGLALVLLEDPQLLLLDEPTNHLDIAMLEWLEEWLAGLKAGVLIVSHDRTFLDRAVNRILELDAASLKLKEYAGNYSQYLLQRQAERDAQWAEYQDQEAYIRQMKQDISATFAQAARTENRTNNDQLRRYAKKVARKAVSRRHRLQQYLDSDERIEKPAPERKMRFAFGRPEYCSRYILTMENGWVGYSQERILLSGVNLMVRPGRRIAITGENGGGKTTLLRTLAGQIPLLSGRLQLGSGIQVGFMQQEQTEINLSKTGVDLLLPYFPDETEVRSFLSAFLILEDEPVKPLSLLSFGQRARLMLAQLIAGGCNLLLLDEPINHLDIPSRLQFEQALAQFKGTVLTVVHDRCFIERFAEEIWQVNQGKVRCEITALGLADL